jgi:hypothetical protein
MDWTAMLLLGAYHGVNPGMGWLFAVALGMQQGSSRGIWHALPALALGHAVSVGGGAPDHPARGGVAAAPSTTGAAAAFLIAIGVYRLCRHRHPRYGGLQVGFRQLALWSFLMASAHGAGLMVLPFALDFSVPVAAASGGHVSHLPTPGANTTTAGAVALAIHTGSYFAVMAAVAWIVYRKVGLAFLRTAWFDMDRVWACSLLITGSVVLVW